jgi:hypothetical protein
MKKALIALFSTVAVSTAFAGGGPAVGSYNYQYMQPTTISNYTFGTPNVYHVQNPNPTREDVKRDYDWAKAHGFVTDGELDYPPKIDKALVSIYPNLTGIYDKSIYTEYGSTP